MAGDMPLHILCGNEGMLEACMDAKHRYAKTVSVVQLLKQVCSKDIDCHTIATFGLFEWNPCIHKSHVDTVNVIAIAPRYSNCPTQHDCNGKGACQQGSACKFDPKNAVTNPTCNCSIPHMESRPYLSNAVVLGEVNGEGYELWGSGQIIHSHQQVQNDCHGVGVDEHGLVAIILGDVVQQSQGYLLKGDLSDQLHCLHEEA